MSKDMNELSKKIITYDLKIGLFISIFIGFLLSFKIAIIYYFGLIIALINFKVSEFILLRSKSKFLIILSSFLRIIVIVLLAIPFVYEMSTILGYTLGFSSHFLFLMIYCLTNNERK